MVAAATWLSKDISWVCGNVVEVGLRKGYIQQDYLKNKGRIKLNSCSRGNYAWAMNDNLSIKVSFNVQDRREGNISESVHFALTTQNEIKFPMRHQHFCFEKRHPLLTACVPHMSPFCVKIICFCISLSNSEKKIKMFFWTE